MGKQVACSTCGGKGYVPCVGCRGHGDQAHRCECGHLHVQVCRACSGSRFQHCPGCAPMGVRGRWFEAADLADHLRRVF